MQNTLREDIQILLKNFFNKDTFLEEEWKNNAFVDGKPDNKKIERLAKILYEIYIHRINITTQFNEPQNIESIKPYQLKYNVKRFWFKQNVSTLAIEPNEIVAMQDGVKIILKEGEYIDGGELESLEPISDTTEYKKQIKEFVYVYLPRKVFKQKDNFYIQTYGDFLLRNYYEPIIRFYFSLEPKRDEVQKFIEKIKDFFNDRRIPFQLKTPFKLSNFGRGDTLVLYVAQNHFYYVREFIIELRSFALRKEILRTNIPLFVKKIYEGVGFAEDPYFIKDSFGMQRVNVIIESINKILERNETITLDNILQQLKNEGYNIKEFYRNPYTNFNYDFEAFDQTVSLNPSFHTYKTGNPIFYEYNQLALEFALDLIEKATWQTKEELIWFSYYQDEGLKEKEIYRVLSDTETAEIYWFLGKIIQISHNRKFFTNPVLKIIEHKANLQIQPKQFRDRMNKFKQMLSSYILLLDNIALKDFENLIEDVSKWSSPQNIEKQKSKLNTFASNIISFIGKNNPITLPTADDIYRGNIIDKDPQIASKLYPYAKMGYPISNNFGNYEYCPNDEGKLRIANIMLYAYCPSLYEKSV
ncbi:MAG: T3SS effector HopA1 family protein [Arcicella sp.]|nr:T3SS effector HopA1 family protein [Arcicella sp.]